MLRGVVAMLAAFCLAGCATSGGRGDRVDEVHLFGMPVTLNLDGKPGTDGFAVRIFVTKDGGGKGAVIKTGAIEVLMFDGVAGLAEITSKQPQQLWKFAARELPKFREQTSLGNGYRFALRWDKPPTRNHITVVARYAPPQGEPVYSSPSAITATIK